MRKIIAACLALLATASIARAQIPALPDTERRTTYTITAQTGPFSVGMDLYCDGTDYAQCVEVWLSGVKLTPTTQWTMDLASGTLATAARPLQNARVTLVTASTGTLQIVGARRPRRTAQFTEGVGVTARQLNQVLTDITAWSREDWDLRLRAIMAPAGESLSPLPSATQRAGMLFGFDATGNPSLIVPSSSPLGGALAAGNIIVGNGGGLAASVPMSGDCTMAAGGAITCTKGSSNPIDVYANGGQSNNQGQSGDPLLSPAVPCGSVLQYSSGTISCGNDPVGNANPSSAWPSFGKDYVAATGRKILFVPSAVGGTDQCATTGASTLNWDLTGTLAPALVANVTAAMAAARAAGYSPTYRGILWSQGENDAGAIGANPVYPTLGATTVTGGPYAAGTTVITVASATGMSINETAIIALDNGTTYSTNITNVVGTTLTLQVAVPVGRSIPNGAPLFIYSQAHYRTCLMNMLNYFRTTTTDGTTFPQLPFYISLTGAPQAGDNLGYQKVRQAQEQVAKTDPYTRIVYRGAPSFVTRGMMQASSLHYLQEGYNEMGREMARNVISSQADDQFVTQNENVYRVALGGTLRNGDVLDITVTASDIAGSPWHITTGVILPGDTFTSFATRVAGNGTVSSPNLAERGIYVTSSGSVITVHQPASRSPQAVVTASWITGGATETAVLTQGAAAQGSNSNPPPTWLDYPPSPNCGTATFTVNAARKKVDLAQKTTSFMVDMTITALGTCSGNNLVFSIPNVTAQAAAFAAGEVSIVGYAVRCTTAAGLGNVACAKNDGSLTWAVNHRIVASGSYENP